MLGLCSLSRPRVYRNDDKRNVWIPVLLSLEMMFPKIVFHCIDDAMMDIDGDTLLRSSLVCECRWLNNGRILESEKKAQKDRNCLEELYRKWVMSLYVRPCHRTARSITGRKRMIIKMPNM